MIRTLAPRLMSAVARSSSVASLPCALSIRYCACVYPASAKAAFRYGASKLTYRVDDVVSGRITPTCRVLAPLVANCVSGLNWDIVEFTSTVKELMLSPAGTLFEPPEVVVDGPDDPQPAAIRPATAARLTQPTRPKRPVALRTGGPTSLTSVTKPHPIPLSPFARIHPNDRRRTPYSTYVP